MLKAISCPIDSLPSMNLLRAEPDDGHAHELADERDAAVGERAQRVVRKLAVT